METTPEVIIQKIESDYADIIRLYRSLPVTAVVEASLPNGWSVKDILAHIAAWERRCASLLKASHDTNALLEAEPDVDALNREIYQERQEWSWEEVEYDSLYGITGCDALEENPFDNAAASSDAFFPFPDSIDQLAGVGVKAIIQPFGSERDHLVVQAANRTKTALVGTGERCFGHF